MNSILWINSTDIMCSSDGFIDSRLRTTAIADSTSFAATVYTLHAPVGVAAIDMHLFSCSTKCGTDRGYIVISEIFP
jgi:hypothetical protein